MLVLNGILQHRYDEVRREGQRLGRHLELDARSLAYTIEEELRQVAPRIRPAAHPPAVPVLDQGKLGSCTGNAGTYALSAAVTSLHLASVALDGRALSAADVPANEDFALALYHRATQEDGFPGTFPPDDTGSSGLGVCRALRAAGLIDRYAWATSLRGLAAMLQRGGAIIGVPWFEAWFDPDSNGFIDTPRWDLSPVVGGHEIYVEALETWDERDPASSVIRFTNSWGPAWGLEGRGRMRLATYSRLKSQIDVKQLVI